MWAIGWYRGFQGHGASTFFTYLLWIPFYLLTFWISTLPWSPLLVMNARRLRAAAPLDWTDRYLVGNAALVFVVFSLMVTKLPHYTLPAFPFLAVLFGRRWMQAGLAPRMPVRTLVIFGLAFALVTLVAVPLLLARGANPSAVAILVKKAGANLTPETKVAMADFQEPNVVWETRHEVNAPVETISVKQIGDFLGRPGSRAVVVSSKALAGVDLRGTDRYEARGLNAARLKKVDLVLVVRRKVK